MSVETIVMAGLAYALMMVFLLCLLTAAKRGDEANRRALAEDERSRRRDDKEGRRDVA
jgi:hypothetical protein